MPEIEDVSRIRYTTSHPRDMDDDLIAAHGEIDKLMPFLHLPVQSGSDSVLEAMNRQHTAEDYRRLIDAHPRARAPTSRSPPISSSAFPAKATRISKRRLQLVRDVGLRAVLFVQIQSAPRHAGRRREKADCRRP